MGIPLGYMKLTTMSKKSKACYWRKYCLLQTSSFQSDLIVQGSQIFLHLFDDIFHLFCKNPSIQSIFFTTFSARMIVRSTCDPSAKCRPTGMLTVRAKFTILKLSCESHILVNISHILWDQISHFHENCQTPLRTCTPN